MYRATVRLTDGAATLTCPAGWLKNWELAAGQVVRVGFGQRFVQVSLAARAAGKRAVVSLPPALRRHLLAPLNVPLNLSRRDGLFKLGPLVGILSSLRPKGAHPAAARLGPQAAFFAQIFRAGRRRGAVIFVFSPAHVAWSRGEVAGVIYRGGRWGRIRVPLPDAVYVRTQSRAADRRPDVARLLRRLALVPDIAVFNQRFFDKWQVYRALAETAETRQYLPETRRYTGPRDLAEMLARYRQVFIKPTGGSLGKNIIRVTQLPGGLYDYRLSLGDGDRHAVLGSLSAVALRVRRRMRRRRCIIQQGLPLARVGGSTFDIRLLMQKNRKGEWAVSSRVARLAAANRLATNVALGGIAVGGMRPLRAALGRAAPTSRRLAEAGRQVAMALERRLGQELSEVGIDLGLDRWGRIWLIEANSRPARNWEWPPQGRVFRSVRGLAEYSLYRTGFLSPAAAVTPSASSSESPSASVPSSPRGEGGVP